MIKLVVIILTIGLASCEILSHHVQQELHYECKIKPDLASNEFTKSYEINTYYVCIKVDCKELKWN